MRKFFVIVNKHANNGIAAQNWSMTEEVLQHKNIQYDKNFTTQPGDAYQLAHDFVATTPSLALENYVILVVGGDGTLNDTINGIKASGKQDVPVAFIPSGNNNSFAAGIGIAASPQKALEQVLNATEPTYYDIGSYSDTLHGETGYFLNDFGIGIDAYIVSLQNQMKKHRLLQKLHLGFIPYLINIFEAYTNQEPFNVRVRVDNQYDFYKHAYLVNIANHPFYNGRNLQLTPQANASDHQLDLIIFENMNIFNFILLGIMIYFRKQLKLPSVHYYKKDAIHVSVNSLEFNQVDGEEKGNKYFDVLFKSVRYPFWINPSSIPVKEREEK